ncbi:MAG TPA: hypothetical protein VGM88_31650 [Kofleriaceae bacterium]|jgi:hypothetical protein
MRALLLVLLAACTQQMEADDQAFSCADLDAAQCKVSFGCHATFEEPGNAPAGDTFVGCAEDNEIFVEPTGVCSTLGEYACGTRSDCVTWEQPGPADGPEFEKCVAE